MNGLRWYIDLLKIDAEWMTVGIKMDADIVLGLVFSQGSAASLSVLTARIEVVDPHFEMDLHLLFAMLGWPDRTLVYIIDVE